MREPVEADLPLYAGLEVDEARVKPAWLIGVTTKLVIATLPLSWPGRGTLDGALAEYLVEGRHDPGHCKRSKERAVTRS